MTAIVCDICRKAVAGARRDTNYFTILDKDLCVDCHDELRDETKAQMAVRRPYLFKDYVDILTKNLLKMTGK